MTYPWYLYPILLRPTQIDANLARVRAAGIVEQVPNLWQIALGVGRMWHRIVLRPESIGLAEHANVRATWRARLFAFRAIRFPFVLWEGSVVPGDLSGLGSTPERLMTHILGTYHDGVQFAYDYQVLEAYPGAPEALMAHARAVVNDPDTRRSRWVRDLAVFDGYHERLISWLEHALEKGPELTQEESEDPDISFHAYLNWCAAQPPTPALTWQAIRHGRFRFPQGCLSQANPMMAASHGSGPRAVA